MPSAHRQALPIFSNNRALCQPPFLTAARNPPNTMPRPNYKPSKELLKQFFAKPSIAVESTPVEDVPPEPTPTPQAQHKDQVVHSHIDLWRMTSKQRKKLAYRDRIACSEKLASKCDCPCSCTDECDENCDLVCMCQESYNPIPPDDWYPSAVETEDREPPQPVDEDPEHTFTMIRNSIEQANELRSAAKYYREHFAEIQAREREHYQAWIHQSELRANFYDTKPACTIPHS